MLACFLSATMGLDVRNPVFGGFANNTGADQPAHPRGLISLSVIRLLESIISKLSSSEISIFQLISVVEETDLSLALSETPTTGLFLRRGPYH